MSEKTKILKKKILYRASYRGTKEMDILLSSFVKKHINIFSDEQLKDLENFKFEDETILNFYNFNIVNKSIDKTKFRVFKKVQNILAEGGFEPTNGCPVAGFQDQCFQPLSHLSLINRSVFITIKVIK